MQTLRTALRGASRGMLAYMLALTLGGGGPPPPPPPVVASGRHRLRANVAPQRAGEPSWKPSAAHMVSAFMAPAGDGCRGQRRNAAKIERRLALAVA